MGTKSTNMKKEDLVRKECVRGTKGKTPGFGKTAEEEALKGNPQAN